MLWKVILEIIAFILGLVAIWFAFGVKKRSEGCLAKSWNFLLFAMITFSIAKIIEVLDDLVLGKIV